MIYILVGGIILYLLLRKKSEADMSEADVIEQWKSGKISMSKMMTHIKKERGITKKTVSKTGKKVIAKIATPIIIEKSAPPPPAPPPKTLTEALSVTVTKQRKRAAAVITSTLAARKAISTKIIGSTKYKVGEHVQYLKQTGFTGIIQSITSSAYYVKSDITGRIFTMRREAEAEIRRV